MSLLLIASIYPVLGQTHNYIKNYPPNVYKASPAVFNLAFDDSGVIYFGTNKGVVIFDGARWELVSISNFSGAKSLEKGPDGKIYVGANGDFGYISKDVTDGFIYNSLFDSVPPGTPNFNDIWQIVFLNDEIYFQSYSGIFKYHKGNITFNEIADIYIFNINNTLYASSFITGSFGEFVDKKIKPIEKFPDLSGDLVFQIFKYSSDEYLLATASSGLFILNSKTEEVHPFKSEVSSFFLKNEFYDGVKISPNLYGLGSWKGGMVFSNNSGEIINKFDKNSGLHANHIYDMKIGNSHDLWLATSNGISRISLDSLGFKSDRDNKMVTPILSNLKFTISNKTIDIYKTNDTYRSVEDEYLVENGVVNIYQLPSSLSLYFATPRFAGEEISYSVFLDGYDKMWSDWKADPLKEYTNLSAGNYTFYVQAKKNIDSVLSEVKAININIYTPWYQSVWVKVIIALFIVLGIYIIIRLMILRLKTQNKRLENIVNNRTQDLRDQQKKLSQLNKDLTISNKELDSFVYHTSHDLKAPLKSVLGLVDLAKREDKQNLFFQYHDLMESSIHKLEEFISSIIQYSSNSKADVHIKSVNFEDLIENAINEIQFHDAFSKIEIIRNININGSFFSDEKRIQIVIKNLISNAIKYYDPKKTDPKISIDINHVDDKAIISIKDNGIGIKEEYQKKVFQMFYRASETSYGSGLGLYIIKETIKKLNGKIDLKSKFGEYTIFTIQLPNLEKSHRLKDKI